MSEFQSEYELFTSVVDPGASGWSQLSRVLNNDHAQPGSTQGASTGDEASSWDQDAELELTLPKISYPGGLPLIAEITINRLDIEVAWSRGGDTNSGGQVRLTDWNIGGGALGHEMENDTAYFAQIDEFGGDLAFWLVNQTQMKAFLNGDVPLFIDTDTNGINGSTQTRIGYVKAKVQYSYTGSGVAFPRLF